MSKATTKARIQTEITEATVNESITPAIVGSILDEMVELPSVLPYKSYTARLSRNGTEPMTAIFEYNELGIITFSKDMGSGMGNFINSTALFTVNKTVLFTNGFASTYQPLKVEIKQFTNSQLSFNVSDASGNLVNVFETIPVEIRVYN
jgi:hypothetical protein